MQVRPLRFLHTSEGALYGNRVYFTHKNTFSIHRVAPIRKPNYWSIAIANATAAQQEQFLAAGISDAEFATRSAAITALEQCID